VLKTLLALAAVLEASTGLALLTGPATVAGLLLGNDLSGASMSLGRIAGLALFSLGIACWPGRDAPAGLAPALRAMLTYNLLVSMYLLYLGARGEWAGRLLWPAVVIHAVLAVLLGHGWFRSRQTEKPRIGDEGEP
jgi:hypothetical protein